MKPVLKFLPLIPAVIIAVAPVFFNVDIMIMVVVLVVMATVCVGGTALAVYFIVLILQDVYSKILELRQSL